MLRTPLRCERRSLQSGAHVPSLGQKADGVGLAATNGHSLRVSAARPPRPQWPGGKGGRRSPPPSSKARRRQGMAFVAWLEFDVSWHNILCLVHQHSRERGSRRGAAVHSRSQKNRKLGRDGEKTRERASGPRFATPQKRERSAESPGGPDPVKRDFEKEGNQAKARSPRLRGGEGGEVPLFEKRRPKWRIRQISPKAKRDGDGGAFRRLRKPDAPLSASDRCGSASCVVPRNV